MKFFKYYFIVLSVMVISCSPSIQPSTSESNYEENLSSLRPEITTTTVEVIEIDLPEEREIPFVEPTNHIAEELDSVLRIKARKNLERGYLQGFTIQVYSGRSREDANTAKWAVEEILIDEKPSVYYDQPRFRVKVGQYYSRLEAEKSLNRLKKRFRQALVLPERIPLN